MRIRTTNTRNGRLFYVIKTVYDSKGKEHSVTVEKLGNENDIREAHGCDPDQWAKEYVAKLNAKEAEDEKEVTLNFSPNKRISRNYQYEYQIGYLFLQALYYKLGIHKICKNISKRHEFEYDLNAVLSRLLYGRVIEPASKRSTYKFAKTLIEKPGFEEHHLYRALDVLSEEFDYIQQELYKNSFKMGVRKTGVIYYDCTNFFFELEQSDPDGIRQYGKSKENRPLPIVEMGLFIDQDGIPLAVCIHPGNTNEQKTLQPLEQKIIQEFGLSKFVVCTDAGLSSKANRRFNSVQSRAFITTCSLKKMKSDMQKWALNPEGWQLAGSRSKKTFNISHLDLTSENAEDRIYYKETWVDQGSFEEKIIVTYSPKYRKYQESVREDQIRRAMTSISSGGVKIKKYNQNDYRRLISRTSVTEQGELANEDIYDLNYEQIEKESAFDGFYAVTTNLDDDPNEIIRINRYRWQIEECFRIMKSEMKARPAYVQTDSHIKAHFLTCFLALILYRYLENALGNRYTCHELISTLKDMSVREVLGAGFIPNYKRSDLTDDLHTTFGFSTDLEIISNDRLKKILKATKS